MLARGGAAWLMCSYCALSGDDISLAACKTYSARTTMHRQRAAQASRLTRIIIIYIYREEEGWICHRRRASAGAAIFFKRPCVGWKKRKEQQGFRRRSLARDSVERCF